MQKNTFTRIINGQKVPIELTTEERNLIYQQLKHEYLAEDFKTALEHQQEIFKEVNLTAEHLENFPEITLWLISVFESIEDSNVSHNDLIGLSLDHLKYALKDASFFTLLAQTATATCLREIKNVTECEKSCSHYYRCDNIATANDRSKHWELLSSLLTMHHMKSCTCRTDGNQKQFCSAALYLNGFYNISDFYHAELGKEAA